METCPICRATLNGADTCRRCRADLRRVQEIEQLGSKLAGAAMLSLATGKPGEAERRLQRARAVHATAEVKALYRAITMARRMPSDPQRYEHAPIAAPPCP